MLSVILSAILLGIIGYVDAVWKYHYWRKRNIPGPIPVPFAGTILDIAWNGQGGFDKKWTDRLGRTFGYFDGPAPVIITSDTEMIKRVAIKDFSHFVNHREVRSVLIPAFTSGKLKHMDTLINECCETMTANFEKLAEKQEVFEAKDLFGKVVLDIIASTFFGVKIGSQKESKSEFAKNAELALGFTFWNPMLLIAFVFPKLVPIAKKLGLSLSNPQAMRFFFDNTTEIMKMRVASKQTRIDFLQLLMASWEENKHAQPVAAKATSNDNDVTDVLSKELFSDGNMEKVQAGHKLTTQEVIAQCMIFFLAGFETTATALSFLSYNLALNQDIQDKLRREIEEIMGNETVPTYELVAKMEYLDMCINENVRLFPPITRTDRECNEEWEYNGVKYERGTIIGFPIFAVHRDAEYWPEPEEFKPERFPRDNKDKITPYSFLTFGQGPRNCIGMRFAYLEMKMVMVHLLQQFRILPTSRTDVSAAIFEKLLDVNEESRLLGAAAIKRQWIPGFEKWNLDQNRKNLIAHAFCDSVATEKIFQIC